MNNYSLKKYILLLFAFVALTACDNDFNEIGSNIVGNDNFELGDGIPYEVHAYTQPLGPVETTNLRSDVSNGIVQLGIYDNPVFGKTTAHVVTELKMQTVNSVDFAKKPVILSAVLTIPYFSTGTTDGTTGETTYELDSIYGADNGKLDLGIYESLYYIRTDHETGLSIPYYNNDLSQFTKGNKLNTSTDNSDQNTAFVFSNAGGIDVVDNDGDGNATDEVNVGPRMKIDLDTTLLGAKLFGPQAVGKLLNNNIFTEYFRGLHFSVAQSGADPTRLAMMNFAAGKITVKYKQFKVVPTDPLEVITPTNSEDKTLVLTLTGNNVNLLETQNSAGYAAGLAQAASEVTTGSERLYLKGGEGSMAVIELFRDANELEDLRAEVKGNWLVNDATLTFFIDDTATGMGQAAATAYEPNRVYLYDLDNKVPLIDFSGDVSTSAASVKYNKRLYDGIIKKNSDGRGTAYKVRITNHIRNLISNPTAKNVRLGLVVTENINVTSNKKVKAPINLPNNTTFASYKKIDEVPTMSVANPFGTILYGTNINPVDKPADYAKRVQLTIYYTKPN